MIQRTQHLPRRSKLFDSAYKMLALNFYKSRPTYTPLLDKQDAQDAQHLLPSVPASPSLETGGSFQGGKKSYTPFLIFSYTLNLLLSVVILLLYLKKGPVVDHSTTASGNLASSPTDLVFTPVPAHLTNIHQIKKFSYGFNPLKSPYQATPPTQSLDHLWKSLYYNVSYLRLSESIASRLPNKTLPYPKQSDPGYNAANLAVFHQLHCLNSIRIALDKEYYLAHSLVDDWKFHPKRGPYGTEHISHCVNVLREAIMCAADTSVVTFQWNDEIKSAQPRSDVLHVCRDFEGIWDWAWDNRGVVPFDPRVRPVDEGEKDTAQRSDQ